MENKIKFSIKLSDSEEKGLEGLKDILSKNHNIYPDKHMNNRSISGDCKDLDLDKIRYYSLKENIKLKLVYYSKEKRIAVMSEIKYGYITSRKILDFNKKIKDESLESKFNDINNYMFSTLELAFKNVEKSNIFLKLNTIVKINSLCNDMNLLNWCKKNDIKELKISNINLKNKEIYVYGYPYRVNINHISPTM